MSVIKGRLNQREAKMVNLQRKKKWKIHRILAFNKRKKTGEKGENPEKPLALKRIFGLTDHYYFSRGGLQGREGKDGYSWLPRDSLREIEGSTTRAQVNKGRRSFSGESWAKREVEETYGRWPGT